MRDVIRVERLPEGMADVDEAALASAEAWGGVSIDGDSLAAIGRVADEVLPSIVARLAVSGLGEIEVRHADWCIRARRAALAVTDGMSGGAPSTTEKASAGDPAAPPDGGSTSRVPDLATSPAVGWFVPRPELAVGSRVTQGDVIGWVDVLGVRQEVVTPASGLVGRLFVGPGEPVEYGQGLAQLVPDGASPAPDERAEARA